MTEVPEGYHYTRSHEWAKKEGSVVVIGITDYAQESLGDIVFVELKDVDTEINAGESFGTIESVKAAEDLNNPVGGIVAATNGSLNDDPAAVNRDPYGSWMIKLKEFKEEDLNNLMDSSAYSEYIASLAD